VQDVHGVEPVFAPHVDEVLEVPTDDEPHPVNSGHRHMQGIVGKFGRNHPCGQVGVAELFDFNARVQDAGGVERARKNLAHVGGCVLQFRFSNDGRDALSLSGFGLLPEQTRVLHPFRVVIATDDGGIEIKGRDMHGFQVAMGERRCPAFFTYSGSTKKS